MKTFPAIVSTFLGSRKGRRNIRILLKMLSILGLLVTLYTILFQYIMAYEYGLGAQTEHYTWIAGMYWTLVTMSTLGFGDIIFHTNLGRIFSMVVLVSGTMFLLVLMPFMFIQFFYAPWMEAQAAARAPTSLPAGTSGHVILTHHDAVTSTLINKLTQFNYPYVLLAQELEQALHLHDLGINVVRADLDDPESYRRIHVKDAALVATTAADAINTNVAVTVREIAPNIPIVASAKLPAAAGILELAGTTHVLQLDVMMGRSLARRAIGGDALTHVIGRVENLLIAEANVRNTPLVGRTLRENRLNEIGVTVAGVWQRGKFELAGPDTMITDQTVLVLAGSEEQLLNYDEQFAIYNVSIAPVVVIGAGGVGQAVARSLGERNIDYRVIDRSKQAAIDPDKLIVGNAAELAVLEQAGISKSPTIIITPHDDNTNIYLTIYCRRLRPDVQLISRATLERNVATLHRAGADFVMSYASMGANAIFNILARSDILMVAEGLDVLRIPVPPSLRGKTLAETSIRAQTGCSVIAVSRNGTMEINPNPNRPLDSDAELVLIGTVEAQRNFLRMYRT